MDSKRRRFKSLPIAHQNRIATTAVSIAAIELARERRERRAAAAMIKAAQPSETGITIYAGPSMFDGAPIVCILTRASRNRKNGDMIQSWIMRSDISPATARRTGANKSACNDCGHQMIVNGAREITTCYVNTQTIENIWHGFHRGKYPIRDIDDPRVAEYLKTSLFRFGAFGDIAALPLSLTESIVAQVDGYTAYTHSWHVTDRRLAQYAMASVDTDEQKAIAESFGYRTFRVRLAGAPVLPSEIVCPASPEAGKRTTCARCLLCNGKRDGRDRRADIVVEAHGTAAKRFDPVADRYQNPIRFLRSRAEL